MCAKIKTEFFCSNCGARSAKWIGRCPSCGEWNTYHEEVLQKESGSRSYVSKREGGSRPRLIHEIEASHEKRQSSGSNELDRVLGGGIVPGALMLIGGEPGIGKSTLMLQIALQIKNTKVLYISGEESDLQLRMRATRLGHDHAECYILTETDTSVIFKHIEDLVPEMVVIDSIQTLTTPSIESSAGSISQIRETAAEFQRYAKESAVPVFLIGHITKDGSLAGPKILEHMVDTVLQFEGDHNHVYRILRAAKNRFGSTSELGIFEMRGNGLREVANPSEILLSQRDEEVSGVTISATIEGQRPILIEAQALVSSAAYGTPQRSSNGFDFKRLNMLLAVLEKRNGFRISAKDVFLNITGGIKVDDPAIDLGVICAVLSSNEDIPISGKACFAAEVGLTGEIRPVTRIEQRITEAAKLGFEEIFVSKYNMKGLEKKEFGIRIHPVNRIDQVFRLLFG
ncbi:MAG: DNA repair protein RadA [Bacteroides sp.]|jgi:DNA repair protein RadA/Sms|nr:DNA repair protein RadA [Bacteroides sp.]